MLSTLTDQKLFITGGAGCIGSALIGELIDQNDVVVYDNLRQNALSGRPYANHPRLRVIRGDVLDIDHMRRAMDGARVVLHCAAIGGSDTVIKSPTETMRINIIGTANALEAARGLRQLEREPLSMRILK